MRGGLPCRPPLCMLGGRPNGRCRSVTPLPHPPGARSVKTTPPLSRWWKGLRERRTDPEKATPSESTSPLSSAAGFDAQDPKEEFNSMLSQFGLADVPTPDDSGHGVRINANHRLEIVDEAASQKRHETALVLSPAPRSLSRRDFLKILAPTKHLTGWRTGGLEEIIPIRSRKNMQRQAGWILIFETPFQAYEYQVRAHQIRGAAKNHMPEFPTAGIQPPQNYSVSSMGDFTLQDYTLTSPWLYPALYAQLHPFMEGVQEAIDMHHNFMSSDNKDDQVFPVRIWVDEEHQISLDPDILKRLISWDAKARGTPWHVTDTDDAYTRMTGRLRHGILDKDGKEPRALAPSPNDNWRILFTDASTARRFVRTWNRKPLPSILALRSSDAIPPVVKAETLFHDDGF